MERRTSFEDDSAAAHAMVPDLRFRAAADGAFGSHAETERRFSLRKVQAKRRCNSAPGKGGFANRSRAEHPQNCSGPIWSSTRKQFLQRLLRPNGR
jgi:hypothetical protein